MSQKLTLKQRVAIANKLIAQGHHKVGDLGVLREYLSSKDRLVVRPSRAVSEDMILRH